MIVFGHLLKFKRETLQMVILPKVEAGELTENFQPDRCIRLSLHWLVVKEGWIVCETLINVSIVLRTGSQFDNTCYFFTSHFSPGKLCTIGISRFPIFQPSKYRTWTWFSWKKQRQTKHYITTVRSSYGILNYILFFCAQYYSFQLQCSAQSSREFFTTNNQF